MTSKTYALSVAQVPKDLCAANLKRKSLKVAIIGSNTAYILSEQTQNAADGYPVTATLPYENKECKSRLWVITDTGTNSVRVQVDSE